MSSLKWQDSENNIEFENGTNIGDIFYLKLFKKDALKYFRKKKRLPCILPFIDIEELSYKC